MAVPIVCPAPYLRFIMRTKDRRGYPPDMKKGMPGQVFFQRGRISWKGRLRQSNSYYLKYKIKYNLNIFVNCTIHRNRENVDWERRRKQTVASCLPRASGAEAFIRDIRGGGKRSVIGSRSAWIRFRYEKRQFISAVSMGLCLIHICADEYSSLNDKRGELSDQISTDRL